MVTIAVLHDAFRVAFRDRQTGLPNRQRARRAAGGAAPQVHARHGRYRPVRGIQRRPGLRLGDQALKMVAARIQHAVGRGNAYRFGGEEFAWSCRGECGRRVAPAGGVARERRVLPARPALPRAGEEYPARPAARRLEGQRDPVAHRQHRCRGQRGGALAPRAVLEEADARWIARRSRGATGQQLMTAKGEISRPHTQVDADVKPHSWAREAMLDTARRVATPEGIELTLRLAGPVPRALAWAVDLAIR